MRAVILSVFLITTAAGSAFASEENMCAKLNGQERASCEKQHMMGHDKMHGKGMSGEMRGEGSKDKGKGAEKGNADHDSHENHGGPKSKAK